MTSEVGSPHGGLGLAARTRCQWPVLEAVHRAGLRYQHRLLREASPVVGGDRADAFSRGRCVVMSDLDDPRALVDRRAVFVAPVSVRLQLREPGGKTWCNGVGDERAPLQFAHVAG